MRQPSPAAAPPPEPAAGSLSIRLGCPKCGAPETIDDETVSLRCDHCDSLLVVAAPDRTEVYLAEGTIAEPAALLETLIEYRVRAYRAEVIHRYKDKDGNPPAEIFIAAQLARFEKTLRERARMVEAHRFFVPYWHVSGKIVQGVLGRRGDGPKLTRVRAFTVEHTVPGYDVARANLRDKGLRLARSRVRPLLAQDVALLKAFVKDAPPAESSWREIDRYRGRDLQRGIESVAKSGQFLFQHRVLVYRPYWVALAEADKGPEWVLFDGSFGTVAGYPDAAEARALRLQACHDPLGAGEAAYRRIVVAASRCPDCGHEQAFDPRDHVAVCPNCHLALEPRPAGIAVTGYDHVVPQTGVSLDATYVPVWSFPFELRIGTTAPITTLPGWGQAVIAGGLPAAAALAGDRLHVPALRLLGTEPGDEVFKAMAEWLHRDPPRVAEGKAPLGGRPRFVGAALSEAEARELGPFVLLGACGKAAAARLNAMGLKRALFDAALSLGPGRLLMVPFARTPQGDLGASGNAVRIPRLLLEGGEALEQMRATVWSEAAR